MKYERKKSIILASKIYIILKRCGFDIQVTPQTNTHRYVERGEQERNKIHKFMFRSLLTNTHTHTHVKKLKIGN